MFSDSPFFSRTLYYRGSVHSFAGPYFRVTRSGPSSKFTRCSKLSVRNHKNLSGLDMINELVGRLLFSHLFASSESAWTKRSSHWPHGPTAMEARAQPAASPQASSWSNARDRFPLLRRGYQIGLESHFEFQNVVRNIPRRCAPGLAASPPRGDSFAQCRTRLRRAEPLPIGGPISEILGWRLTVRVGSDSLASQAYFVPRTQKACATRFLRSLHGSTTCAHGERARSGAHHPK